MYRNIENKNRKKIKEIAIVLSLYNKDFRPSILPPLKAMAYREIWKLSSDFLHSSLKMSREV